MATDPRDPPTRDTHSPQLQVLGAGQQCAASPARQLVAVVLELSGDDSTPLRVQFLPPVDAVAMLWRTRPVRGPFQRRYFPAGEKKAECRALLSSGTAVGDARALCLTTQGSRGQSLPWRRPSSQGRSVLSLPCVPSLLEAPNW